MQRLPDHPSTPATVAAHDTLMTTPGHLADGARIPFDTFQGPPVPSTSRAIAYATPQRQALVARLEHLEAQIEARTTAGEAPSRFDHELFTLMQQLEAKVAQFQDQLSVQLPQLVGAQVQTATEHSHAQMQTAIAQK